MTKQDNLLGGMDAAHKSAPTAAKADMSLPTATRRCAMKGLKCTHADAVAAEATHGGDPLATVAMHLLAIFTWFVGATTFPAITADGMSLPAITADEMSHRVNTADEMSLPGIYVVATTFRRRILVATPTLAEVIPAVVMTALRDPRPDHLPLRETGIPGQIDLSPGTAAKINFTPATSL